MAPTSMTRYCKIYNYVRHKDPQFAEAIEDLCLVRNLSTFKDYGLSFIMPDKETTRKEIVKMAYGHNPEEAITLINAHIILDNLDEPTTTTSNKLGFEVKVSGSGGSLTLNNLQVERAADFKPMTNKRISVWNAKSGKPTLDGTRVERKAFKGKPNKGKGKGKARGEALMDYTYNVRQRLLNDIKGGYADALIESATVGGVDGGAATARAKAVNAHVLSLFKDCGCSDCAKALKMVAATGGDDNPIVESMMLMNPNVQTAGALVKAYNCRKDHVGKTLMDAEDWDRMRTSGGVSGGAENDIGEQVANIRKSILGAAEISGTVSGGATTNIMGAYEEMYRNNTVGGVQAFSDDVADEFSRTGGAPALLRDLMRHDIASSLKSIEEDTTPTTEYDIRADVDDVFARAKNMYGGVDETDVQKSLYMFNQNGNGYVKSDAANVMDVTKSDFVNSSDFMYHPASGSVIMGGSEDDNYFFDRRDYSQRYASGGDDAEMRARLKSLW